MEDVLLSYLSRLMECDMFDTKQIDLLSPLMAAAEHGIKAKKHAQEFILCVF